MSLGHWEELMVVSELADVIIYIIDLTESCGYSVESQEKLLKKLKDKKVLIYLSKSDLFSEDFEYKHKHYTMEEIKEKIFNLALQHPRTEKTFKSIEEI